MSTIFIGGSRQISRLPPEVKSTLDNVVDNHHRVIVGDASGADKAIQKHFLDKQYQLVTVYCSGPTPRNNLGTWNTFRVDAPKSAKGFQFYAAKDREMARDADYGLMIWDGRSPGTILNVLRLAIAGKIAVLFNLPEKNVVNIKTLDSWKRFISQCSHELQENVKERATQDEWRLVESNHQVETGPVSDDRTPNLHPNVSTVGTVLSQSTLPFEQILNDLNKALERGDTQGIIRMIDAIAIERGMRNLTRDVTSSEIGTLLKFFSSAGLKLEAKDKLSHTS